MQLSTLAKQEIKDTRYQNAIYQVAGRLNDLLRNISLGIVENKETSINIIRNDFLELLSKIEAEEEGHQEWFDTIALNHILKPPTLFLGREEKMQEVADALIGCKFTLLLNGLGGIGKTALALEFMNKQKGDYRNIAWVSVNTDENN